tara:strand:+ start:1297 stop:1770 length:474 start_codon:yes stop_codon:yes gene_type:complete
MKKLKLTLLLFIPFSLFAQETVPATGGDASGSGGTVAYSVGQVVYTTNTGTNGSIAQGVQQPYEISTVTGVDNMPEIQIELTAYPNPTKDNLMLRVEDDSFSDLSFELYDMQGKLLESNKLISNSVTIKMEHLSRATYFLRVNNNKLLIKTFQIIKN